MHSKLLIKNLLSEKQSERDISILVFQAILNCSNVPGHYPIDENCSTLTFGFWYTLQVCCYYLVLHSIISTLERILNFEHLQKILIMYIDF